MGNRTSRTSTVAGISTVASSTYDANDRLNGNIYNNNGDTTVAGGVTYGYDFRDKLTSATGGIAMTYDGDGNRVSQTAGGTTTQYLVDDLNPTGYPQVVEELVSGTVQRTYTYGHDLISQNRLVSATWTPRFYGYDGLGSVRLLTDVAVIFPYPLIPASLLPTDGHQLRPRRQYDGPDHPAHRRPPTLGNSCDQKRKRDLDSPPPDRIC